MEHNDESSNKNESLDLISGYGNSDSEPDDNTAMDQLEDDVQDNVDFNTMVLKNNIINACAHGPLSGNANTVPNPDTLRDMIIESSENDLVNYQVTEYRDLDNDSDSSSSTFSSNSDVESVKDVVDVSASDDDERGGGGKQGKKETPRVMGELGLDDLPPIEDLAISLPEEETEPIGKVMSIIDRLVIVAANPGTAPVNLDSVLFLDKGARVLGKVFDVFGAINDPHYCIRFNSEEHVKEHNIEIGMDVYIAPKTPHTSYVFVSELMKLKGSDASWLNDIEPPSSQLDYSDDEEERRVNRLRKEQRKQGAQSEETSERRPTLEAVRRNQRPSDANSRFGNNTNNRNRGSTFVRGKRGNVNIPPPQHMLNQNSGSQIRPPPGFNTCPDMNVCVPPGFERNAALQNCRPFAMPPRHLFVMTRPPQDMYGPMSGPIFRMHPRNPFQYPPRPSPPPAFSSSNPFAYGDGPRWGYGRGFRPHME